MSETYWVIQDDEKKGCLGCAFLEPISGDCPKIAYPNGSTYGNVCHLMDSVHGGKHIFLKESDKQ